MIVKKHRFHGYGSLKKVYERGQTVRGNLISLRFLQHPGNRPYRVAVVVSRKVSKSAVRRNRIRRRVYEIVRTSTRIPEGTDLILTAFNEQLADMSSEDLQSVINDLLGKLNNTK